MKKFSAFSHIDGYLKNVDSNSQNRYTVKFCSSSYFMCGCFEGYTHKQLTIYARHVVWYSNPNNSFLHLISIPLIYHFKWKLISPGIKVNKKTYFVEFEHIFRFYIVVCSMGRDILFTRSFVTLLYMNVDTLGWSLFMIIFSL